MGCFYTGFDYKNRKNGYWKNGETGGKTPAARLAVIRHYDSFQCLGYLIFHNETKSERLFVESMVRVKMERAGFEQVQNDHFLYKIEEGRKYEQAEEIAKQVMAWAIEACEFIGIDYEIGTKKYKRS